MVTSAGPAADVVDVVYVKTYCDDPYSLDGVHHLTRFLYTQQFRQRSLMTCYYCMRLLWGCETIHEEDELELS